MARKFYIKTENTFEYNQQILVDGDEFNHIANVLRYKVGDNISVIDGSGTDYDCKITQINKKNLVLVVEGLKDCNAEAKTNVTVFQALVKGDKFEVIIQKLTELGIKKLVPFHSEFCQVKPNTTRLDRLEKISIEALKQCGRAKKVEIENILSFDKMIESLKDYDTIIFAYENATLSLARDMFLTNNKVSKNVAIIVGSEGGFSKAEVDKLTKLNNVKMVTMGNRILRAETASIALTSVVMYLLGEWDKYEDS